MPKRHDCQARQYGDQMICAACGLYWDVNDPEPPECRKVDGRTRKVKAAGRFEEEPTPRTRTGLPENLPADVAVEMVKAFQVRGGHIAGMRAAYRILLDRMEI